MFEVIISTVSTGHVLRKRFRTWDRARKFADRHLDRQLALHPHSYPHDYRVQINYVAPKFDCVPEYLVARYVPVAA
jgi:hypothetical protein